MTSSDSWLTEALATRDAERVVANMAAAGERLNDARRHVRSAGRLAEDDPTLAIAACHHAIRKAITAHMSAAGLRARAGDGAHRINLEYARHQRADVIAASALREADDSRRDRALAGYGDVASRQLSAEHVLAAADVAERVVDAVAHGLASQRSRRPT